MGPFGAGYVARDWDGNIITLGATKLAEGTNNNSKAQFAIESLKMAKALGLHKIHLEGDSQIIIKVINKGDIHAWKLNKFITLAKSILETFDDYEVSHVVRPGNELVNRLSNGAISFNDEGLSTIEVLNDITLD